MPENGTGVYVGAAWIVSSMPADCKLLTVEIDQELVAKRVLISFGFDPLTIAKGPRINCRCAQFRDAILPGTGGSWRHVPRLR
jgi:hypothetical protein